MTDVLAVNSTVLPDPAYTCYKAIRREIVKADRNVEGDMVMARINTKYTIYVEWRGITNAQKNTILNATSGDGNEGGAFYVTFFSTMNDHTYSGWFYRGDMGEDSIEPFGKFDGKFPYYNLKLSLIQL